MICFVSCNGYRVLDTVSMRKDNDLPGICRKLEKQQGDGYAVFASEDGHWIADADGYSDNGTEYQCDAASATGMYDLY